MSGLVAMMGGASGTAATVARAAQSRAALDEELVIAFGSVRIMMGRS